MRINRIGSDIVELLKGKLGKREVEKSSEQPEMKRVEVEKSRVRVELEEVRREKVEAIKAAIRSGNYAVDVHRISEAMLEEFLGG